MNLPTGAKDLIIRYMGLGLLRYRIVYIYMRFKDH